MIWSAVLAMEVPFIACASRFDGLAYCQLYARGLGRDQQPMQMLYEISLILRSRARSNASDLSCASLNIAES